MKLRIPDFSKYCVPARVYLVLAFISVLLYVFTSLSGFGDGPVPCDTNIADCDAKKNYALTQPNYSVISFITNIIFILLWATLLNYICNKYKSTGVIISWILVILPIVFVILAMFMFLPILPHILEDRIQNERKRIM